jgi:alkanesulfonate monooxygenase SsuD/methylene tetrahydromethanopterin reductase-like flavin-dependent oxidoreductase (luciferase family)
MQVGLQFIIQNTHDGAMSDAEMFRQETELAVMAEDLGLDFVQAPEHHFDPGYSMCPDNMQWLAYVGGRTSTIGVGCGAIILPWWGNPLRVIEKISMLDILLGDRFILGFGRGLSRKEYEIFGVDMATSRQRFDQAADLILDALETGVAEWDTEYFQQSRTEITPKPPRGFRNRRFYSVAMTPDSGIAAANLGATMMSFVQLPWEMHHEGIVAWREHFAKVHPEKDAGAPGMTDFTYCHADAAVAEETARKYLSKSFKTVITHYDFDGSHWGNTAGYTAYQAGADAINEVGVDAAAEGFVQSQCWGTPDQILTEWQRRVDMSGDLRPTLAVSYAGMPFDMVRDSLALISKEVAPELRKMGANVKVGA